MMGRGQDSGTVAARPRSGGKPPRPPAAAALEALDLPPGAEGVVIFQNDDEWVMQLVKRPVPYFVGGDWVEIATVAALTPSLETAIRQRLAAAALRPKTR